MLQKRKVLNDMKTRLSADKRVVHICDMCDKEFRYLHITNTEKRSDRLKDINRSIEGCCLCYEGKVFPRCDLVW